MVYRDYIRIMQGSSTPLFWSAKRPAGADRMLRQDGRPAVCDSACEVRDPSEGLGFRVGLLGSFPQ